jgi:regulator of sigma E protease
LASNDTPTPAGNSVSVPAIPATPAGFLARNMTTVVCVVLGVALAWYLLKDSADWLDDVFSLLKMIAGLGLVIFIHELGHFAAAKLCDVHVQTFSIGFGPPFLGICVLKWGETTYKIGWIPLGGFVKMVGEGEDNEENTEDPRSYKNKRVWQRMIIISAGVTMNMLLALICYVFVFMTHGEDRNVGVVGSVAPGGPAWKKGLRPGAFIHQIGNRTEPYYDELQREVMRAGKDSAVAIVFDDYGPSGASKRYDTAITPVRSDEILAPMLLIRSGTTPALLRRTGDIKQPVIPGSAAANATPPLESGDRVIAATDPDDSAKITPLRTDPRLPGTGALDYYDLERRIQRLAMKPIVLRVERAGSSNPVDITVPPAFARTVGLRMQMGQVVAVRENSPAASAELHLREGKTDGDIIDAVEVIGADGKKVRYSAEPGAGDEPLDPMRLPTQLAVWAASQPKDYTVKLMLARREGHGREAREVKLTWDRNWDLYDTPPSAWTVEMPMSIAGLGLAYQVESTVAGIDPGSPAASSAIKPKDVISAVSFKLEASGKQKQDASDVKEDQWAYFGSYLYTSPQITEVVVTVKGGEKVTLTPVEDKTWPLPERGMVFEPEKRNVKADGIGEALDMSSKRVVIKMMTIYENLLGVLRGKLSFRAFGGPLTIGKRAFDLAGHDMFEFILFIALININLAVVNFLPIPVLDGGHMVFLFYEGLRGKPPSDRWRFILTIMGLVVVLGLMLLTLGLDFDRYVLPTLKRWLGW